MKGTVKRGIVNCLYDRAKHLTSNERISFFICAKAHKDNKTNNQQEPTQEFKSTVVLPYIKGVPEALRRCLQQQGVRTVFKSAQLLGLT